MVVRIERVWEDRDLVDLVLDDQVLDDQVLDDRFWSGKAE